MLQATQVNIGINTVKFKFCELFLNMLTHKHILRNNNPSVKNQRFLPAPFTQGSLWYGGNLYAFPFSVASRPSGCPPEATNRAVAQTHTSTKTGRSYRPASGFMQFLLRTSPERPGDGIILLFVPLPLQEQAAFRFLPRWLPSSCPGCSLLPPGSPGTGTYPADQ